MDDPETNQAGAVHSKAQVLAALRHADYPPATLDALTARLPDPVDVDREGQLLQEYGVTLDAVKSRLGGSP